MMHPIAGADAVVYGQLNCSFNLAGFIIPVEHENGDKVLDPVCFALCAAKPLQKKVQGPRPALPPLLDRPGAIESQRPLLN